MIEPLNEVEKQLLASILNQPVFIKACSIVLSQRKVSFATMEAAAIAHGYNEGKLAFAADLSALVREEKKPSTHLRARRIKPHSL